MMLMQSVTDYLTELEIEKNVTADSLRNYRSTLTRYARRFDKVTDQSVKTFLREYKNPASRNVNLVRLQGFAEFLETPLKKVSRAKEPVKSPDALSSAEVMRLVSAVNEIEPAYAAVAEFLFLTGLRYHELLGLTQQSLSVRDSNASLIVKGKGRKTRSIALNARARNLFDNLPTMNTFFEKRFRQVLVRAGIVAQLPCKAHPHLLRASLASVMINERKVDSVVVAKILGWASVNTLSNHYFKPDYQTLAAAVA